MNTRHQVRDALQPILAAALVGAGLPVQSVLAYPPGDLHGESPVVYLRSAGANRLPHLLEQCSATYRLDVVVLVLQSDGDAWTTANAEDALDDIEALIAATVDASQRPAGRTWQAIDYAGPSAADLVTISGYPYRREVIPLSVTVLA